MGGKLGSCATCNGSRHVRGPGDSWEKCGCLKRAQAQELYRSAGIPVRFDRESWRSFLAAWSPSPARELVECAKALRAGEQPDVSLVLWGRPSMGRELAAALLLRSACDGGLGAVSVDLPRLIDREFRRDDASTAGPDPYRAKVLVVSVGNEPSHKWNKPTLEKAVRARWDQGLFTVVVAQVEPARIAGIYGSVLLDEAFSERFARISINKREG